MVIVFPDDHGHPVPLQEFYVSIVVHWDGKKKYRTTVHGFREGTSNEWMLQHLKNWFRCKGEIVQDPRLGEVIQLQGDWGTAVGNHLVGFKMATKQQIDILEFDGQYNVIRKIW